MRFKTSSLFAVSLLGLTACGGGGGGGSEPTPPTPEPPATVKETFTIEGATQGTPLANALVTATIGDDSFTTNADDSGHFSLAMEYDAGALLDSDMIQLTAKGLGHQSHIELASILGSFGAIKNQAGEDLVLSTGESVRTQLSHLGTATLLWAKNSTTSLNSDASLTSAEATLSSERVWELAATIRTLADNPDYTPAEGTTLSLFSAAPQALRSQIEQSLVNLGWMGNAGNIDPEFKKARDAARLTLLNDDGVQAKFTNDALVGTSVFSFTPAEGWVANLGYVAQLSEDGKAILNYNAGSTRVIQEDVTGRWQLDDQGALTISVDLEAEKIFHQLDYEQVVERWGQEVADALPKDQNNYYLASITTQEPLKISRLTGSDEVVVQRSYRVTLEREKDAAGWEGELPSYVVSEQTFMIWQPLPEQPSLWTSAPSGTWALSMPDQVTMLSSDPSGLVEQVVPRVVDLSANNQLLDSQGKAIGQWRFENGSLKLNLDSGWEMIYTPVAENSGLYSVMHIASKEGHRQSNLSWMAQYAPEQAGLEQSLIQELPMVIGSFSYDWSQYWGGHTQAHIESVRGYLLEASGRAHTIRSRDQDENYDHTRKWYFTASDWSEGWQKLEELGEYSYGLVNSTNEGGGTQLRQGQWTSVRKLEDGRQVVIEQEMVYRDYSNEAYEDISYLSIPPRMAVLAPIDLSQFEEAYQRSLEQGTLDGLN
ncbi:hypothetical protein [Ferrimonas sp. YFM]|uniref:hypothetical protein n=1 Tax=Ferrimonas sp. YFM TaxID=3028878 RepID=UPI0025742572|nr:hypothetical protein [Ferrimonas sp. YFM]BDY03035.1 hypothetical protein F0521_00760 [Ferrimonas sp. YFM]